MRSSFENFDQSVDETIKLLGSEGLEDAWSSKCDGSNAILLQQKKKSKTKDTSQGKVKGAACLSKSQKRKLKKLQEEKEKKALELKSIRILEKYKIQDNAYSLLQSSGNMGQVETKREKRRRAMYLSKAGLEVPQDYPPFKKKSSGGISGHSELTVEIDIDNDKSHSKQDHHDNGCLQPMIFERDNVSSCAILDSSVSSCVILDSYPMATCSSRQNTDAGTHSPLTIFEIANEETGKCMQGDQNSSPITCNYAGGKNTEPQVDGSKMVCQNASILADHMMLRPVNDRAIMHVSRPHEVESKRGDLPIVMMEQEIMEAINENSTVIICGETGCGKTTQVPQFLYEAGFASSKCNARKGIIGVTQPRRVAVLATAKRVAFELGFHLGKEVGFQVRHDKKIGENCSIKFMTDGILLREVQSDFLLKRYSIIILDEAHERSLNTDILIGMLSRIIQIRQELYVEQQEKILSGMSITPENMITQLRLILMSATLRVEDFVSDRRLFRYPPPVIEVPTRQFPVTIHFSKRTELVDYVGQAYRKVMLIHKKLPPGGILVFVTGQREVEYLCKKLRKASEQLIKNSSKGKSDDGVDPVSDVGRIEQGSDMKDINEAFGGHSHDPQIGRFSSCDEELDDIEKDSYSSESSTDSELVVDSEGENSSNDETPEKTNMVADVLGEVGSLDSLKAAFEALSRNAPNTSHKEKSYPVTPARDVCSEQSPINGRKHGVNGLCAGTLCVLPLYAMLSAAEQLRVFEDVHEGERLVVVATNVAETSLTIPGIKYVVDTGREKVKNYNCANGMAAYEVQWISKASAAQRAGRAGRTGPGHCYRLYSSAVFNNIFLDFSSAEITKIPVDGVVLVMKFMGIDKVANFPFPTPPETTALVEAERCLKALGALESKGRLTPIGKAMAQYPMSPRHSRMLLTVIQIMRNQRDYGRANLVLGYTVAAAAALSFTSPFIMQFGGCNEIKDNLDQEVKCNTLGDGQGENNAKKGTSADKILDQQEKQRQKKLKAMAKEARTKFCNPSSDALTVAYALQAFELAGNPVELCKNNLLHLKTMDEMSKLRKQLLRLIFHQSAVGGLQQEFSWTHGNVDDVERAWRVPVDKHPLLLNEEELLGQAICAGWADRVAMRIRTVSELSDKDRKINAARYQACMVNETVFLHRWSSVSRSAPELLVYSELLQSKRPYMHGVTSVKSEWLVKYGKSLCSFSAPLTDPKPYYDPSTDLVLCWVSPTFGPHLWQLPLHSLPIKNDVLRVSVFAYSLLAGNILPCIKPAQKFMAAPPASILRPEAAGQRRVGNLLNKLKMGSRMIDSRAALRETWNMNPQALHSEILCWFQEKYHDMFEELWAQMHHEILLEAHELFPKRTKKEKKKSL